MLPVILLSWPLSRRWFGNWGATPLECSKVWPGDMLTPSAVTTFTRAIDIDMPTSTVWQWVVQFGLYRAGFYSYELLERLAGILVKNVESILPTYQSLELGAKIKLHTKDPGIPVGALSEGRYLCFAQLDATTDGTLDPRRSWSIYIEPRGENSCRLFVRNCIEEIRKPTIRKQLALAFEAPIDFLMEQRMLRTIRRLAENVKSCSV
ncbi:hypothetical protein ACFLR6_02745 [Campylobacterota bacterium]